MAASSDAEIVALEQRFWQALSPFDRRDAVAVQVLLQTLPQLGLNALQAVQVDVIQHKAAAVLVLDHE